ncbi:MAG: HNH endonuclease [Peptococcales bacterium]|jgi:5-methylcytosine-specific restriction endonuclease McrA
MKPKKQLRPDQSGPHRNVYERNKRRLMKTQTHCHICNGELDFNIKWPDPLSVVCDHIIPISKGGSPSDISNMSLCHNICNSAKSDKLFANKQQQKEEVRTNRNLPQSIQWAKYRYDENTGESNQDELMGKK